MREVHEGRILGALRFVDATTGLRIRRALRVESEVLRLYRNRSGDYAILGAGPQLASHTEAFEKAPATPLAGALSFLLRVKDPGGEFLPAEVTVKLPRQSDPAKATQEDSIFRPVEVRLHSAPTRSPEANWCVVRVSVRTAGQQPLAGAGIRVTRDDDLQPAQFGVTAADGEAMVALAGLPFLFVSTGGAGDVIETRTPGKIAVFLHKDGVAVTPDMMRANDVKLEAKGDTAVQLGAGVSLHHLFTVSP